MLMYQHVAYRHILAYFCIDVILERKEGRKRELMMERRR